MAGIFLLFEEVEVSEWPGIISGSVREAFLPAPPRFLAEFDLSLPKPPSSLLLEEPSITPREREVRPRREISRAESAPPAPFRTIRITQLSAGVSASGDEFIELHNPTLEPVPLSGWSLRKKNADGTLESLVSKVVFEKKVIPARSFFLLVNAGGYLGSIPPDGRWAKSNTLTYDEHALVLSDAEGRIVDEVVLPLIRKGEAALRTPEGWDVALPAPRNSFVHD